MSGSKNIAAVVAWLGYLVVIAYLADMMGPVAIPFAAIMMAPLIVFMNFLMKNKDDSKNHGQIALTEKRKRERIDTMIRDMSDDELYELRQRLQDGSFDEDVLYDRVVGDDGELVRR